MDLYRQYNSTTKRSDVDHTELPANTPHLVTHGSLEPACRGFVSCDFLFKKIFYMNIHFKVSFDFYILSFSCFQLRFYLTHIAASDASN